MDDFLLKLKPGDVFITLDNDWEDDSISVDIHRTLAINANSDIFVDRISYYLNSEEEFESEREKLMIDSDCFPNDENIFLIENDYWDLAKKGHEENNKKVFDQIEDELRVLIEFMEENL